MSESKAVTHAYLEAKRARALHADRWDVMNGFPPTLDKLVTHQNFMAPPNNRWGFKHLEKLTRSTTVSRGGGSISPLINTLQDLSGVVFKSKSGSTVTVKEHLAATFTDGFIVLKNGACLYEAYFDNFLPADRHIMFSVTKSIVGLLAEDFVASKVLDELLTVGEYVPELAASAFGDATIRQVMNMVVGVNYHESYEDPNNITAQYAYASGLWSRPEGSDHSDNICDYLKKLEKKGEHGVCFDYITPCTEVLAWVVERASGRSIAAHVEEIWSQLGCERDAYFVNDAQGRVCSGGGFNATLRDMARFALMVSQKGEWKGKQLVSSAAVDRLFEGADPEHYARNEEYSSWTPGASYRSQWYVYSGQSIMAVGIHGQIIYINRLSNIVIVKQSSSPTAETPLSTDTVVMLQTLADVLS